jgi:hypothetical protein
MAKKRGSRLNSWYSPKKWGETAATCILEIKDQSDRGAAIIAAANLDSLLEEAIRHWLAVNDKTTEGLFQFPQALSSFGSKLQIAYAVGIIGKRAYADLDQIREIRNRFAHVPVTEDDNDRIASITFNTQDICDRCRALRFPEDWPLAARAEFEATGTIKLQQGVNSESVKVMAKNAEGMIKCGRGGGDPRTRFLNTVNGFVMLLYGSCLLPKGDRSWCIEY